MKYPGFVDVQVNGYKGIHLSQPKLRAEDVHTMTMNLAAVGTAAYCPTVVSSPFEHYPKIFAALAEAMACQDIAPRLLGIHLEGPFISPADGARGAHPLPHVRKPSIEDFKRLQDWAGGNIRLVTLAPEVEGAIPLIEYLVGEGLTVSLGHHFADDSVLRDAVAAGARACTHLGNGFPSTVDRHNNPLWFQLAEDNLTGMFICDGHHLPDDYIKVALRAKTVTHSVVVSDGTHISGLAPGKYDFQEHFVVLAPNGRISFGDTPYLAGSSATMLECMNYLAALELLSEEELWQVGAANPLQLVGRNLSDLGLLPGAGIVFEHDRFKLLGGPKQGSK